MFKDKKIIITSIILGTIFSFFYNYFVVGSFKELEFKLRNVNTTQLNFPQKDTYLLKVWGLEVPQEVYFNDNRLKHFYFRQREGLKELLFSLSEDLVNEGLNSLKIVSPLSYSVRIKNCLGTAEYGSVLFDSSRFLKENPFSLTKFLLGIVVVSLFLFYSYKFIFFILKRYLKFYSEVLFLKYTFSFLPCFLFFLFIYSIFKFTPYRFITNFISFFGMSIFLVVTVQVLVFFFYLGKPLRNSFLIAITAGELKPYLIDNKVIKWVVTAEFLDKCFLTFFALLTFCEFALIFKLEPIAMQLANIAYVVLFIAVTIKFIKFIRE